MSYIYVITNDINGKQYVGKTNDTIEARFKRHLLDANKRVCEKRPLYDAINKYGKKHFSIEELEKCDESIVNEREQYWIKELNTYGKTGYNATLGGDSRHYYNYEEIANKYLELGTVYKTAEYFNCDKDTVRVACLNCNVKIITPQEKAKKNSKKVVQIDKDTLRHIKIYESISEASRQTGINHGSISRACRGKNKTAGGFIWESVN